MEEKLKLFLPPNKYLYMRKRRINRKVKKDVPKHKDNSGNSGSLSAYGGNDSANSDAGELKSDKFAVSKEANKLWQKDAVPDKNKTAIKESIFSGAGKAFIIFSALVILDYFLTIYAIRQHFSEFNPLTVFIYRNFQSPEIIFLFFKIAVIVLNGLLIYLINCLGKNVKLFKKVALVYALLAAIFAFAVVVYDVGIITGVLTLPDFANGFIFSFFRFFGMI